MRIAAFIENQKQYTTDYLIICDLLRFFIYIAASLPPWLQQLIVSYCYLQLELEWAWKITVEPSSSFYDEFRASRAELELEYM